MGRIDFFLGALVCCLVFPGCTPGFSGSASLTTSTVDLSGSIFSEGANLRIARADVVLCDEGGAPLQENTPDDSGDFSFQGLRPGHYVLRVTAPGYQRSELHVDLSYTSQRGLMVSLKPERPVGPDGPERETISAHELAMPEKARVFLASGKKKLYAEKNAQGALSDFQSATQQAPTFYEAYYQAGMAYLSLTNPGEAEKQFRKAVEISGQKYGDADIALSTLLLHRNQVNEGESLLRKGLAANPNSWPGQFELGELEVSRGHMEAALAAAKKAEELAPEQPVVYRLMAVILLRQKNYPALVSALDSYIALDPDSPAGVRAKELRTQAQREIREAKEAAVAVK